MKKVLTLFIGLVILSILAVGGLACGGDDNGNAGVSKQVSIEVSYDEFQASSASSGGSVVKTIEAATGNSIVVTLWSNATTGYSWSESATISDTSVLQQAGHVYVAPEANGLVGASGKEAWTFNTLKTGTCEVSMSYSQPWAGGQKNAYTFSLAVTVK